MDATTRAQWDRLCAEWDAAKQQLDRHWLEKPENGPDLQWQADHRT